MNIFDITKEIKSSLDACFEEQGKRIKIYPVIAPIDVDYPYLVVRKAAGHDGITKDLRTPETASVEILACGARYEQSNELARMAYEGMEKFFGRTPYSMSENSEYWQDEAFIQRLVFEFLL